MEQDDIAYYQLRYLAELAQSQSAGHPKVAEVHRELAARYFRLLQPLVA